MLEDLRTGQRVHVVELDDLGSAVANWLAVAPDGEPVAGQIAGDVT